MKGPAKQSNRAWLIQALRDVLGRLSQDERNHLAAELGIIPQFRIVFVRGEDGRPAGESRL
jgi:hypothetical protein